MVFGLWTYSEVVERCQSCDELAVKEVVRGVYRSHARVGVVVCVHTKTEGSGGPKRSCPPMVVVVVETVHSGINRTIRKIMVVTTKAVNVGENMFTFLKNIPSLKGLSSFAFSIFFGVSLLSISFWLLSQFLLDLNQKTLPSRIRSTLHSTN